MVCVVGVPWCLGLFPQISYWSQHTVLSQKFVRLSARATTTPQFSRATPSLTAYHSINMSSFSAEISGNRMRGGELSEAQRIYCLAQVEAGVRTSKVAGALNCSQRCVQKTVARWKATSSNTSRPRAGRPPILTSRDHRQLLRIARKNPRIEYQKLL